jgi:hypothetical protein
VVVLRLHKPSLVTLLAGMYKQLSYLAYQGNYPENWLPSHDRVTLERTVTLLNWLMCRTMYLVRYQYYPTTNNA